ncbi:quinone oxidoreductase [Curtobacterium sp. MCBD17_030]|nr:quinone oxidoreductase [Curtobacterium sp. MCBD17_030]
MMGTVVYQHGWGSPEVLEIAQRVAPRPGRNELGIKQEAVGLNHLDLLFRRGPFRPPSDPFVNGFEGAGVVTAVGSGAESFQVGDRVGYFSASGAYAAERTVSTSDVVRLPAATSSLRAAALMTKGLTARMALRQAYQVQSGDVIIVTGATGAIGSILTLWCTSLGAKVVAVVGSAAKAEQAVANGAVATVVNGTSIKAVVDSVTLGGGADAALDGVGGDQVSALIPAVRRGGYIVSYGNAAGRANPDRVELERRAISFDDPPLSKYLHGQEEAQRAVDDIFRADDHGVFAALPVRELELTEIRRAHADLEERRILGVTVLTT